MIKEFKTKAEAYLLIEEEEAFYASEHYCPLLKDNCNTDCVAFHRLYVTDSKKGKKPFKVRIDLGCANKMFFGEG